MVSVNFIKKQKIKLINNISSNLLTWESFGKELASDPKNARDTWLIELTRGPTQDCDTCPNYKYEDLVDYYWTALIAGVEKYSGQNKLIQKPSKLKNEN